MNRQSSFVVFMTAATLLQAPLAVADTFGVEANSFEIEFVLIGNRGNPPDTTDRPVTDGAVPYNYRMGKYEISEQMIDKANAAAAASGSPLNITHDVRGPDKPATSISWFEAARFVNWLNESEGNTPAYKFDGAGDFQLWQPGDPGYNANNLYRNKLAMYVLPSLDEWHKAAYYDPVAGTYYDYPTGSDSVPDGIDFLGDTIFDAVFDDGANQLGPNDIFNAGVQSRYGTVGQGGNIAEWEETEAGRRNITPGGSRRFRGGNYGFGSSVLLAANQNGVGASSQNNGLGFRVVSIPEPSSLLLLIIARMGMLRRFGRRSRENL